MGQFQGGAPETLPNPLMSSALRSGAGIGSLQETDRGEDSAHLAECLLFSGTTGQLTLVGYFKCFKG